MFAPYLCALTPPVCKLLSFSTLTYYDFYLYKNHKLYFVLTKLNNYK